MHLFEKIFNYQILSRLHDSGTFAVTSQERAWLAGMLNHPAAQDAFAPETLAKLQSLLAGEPPMDTVGALIEKARSVEQHVYHPLLRPLRRMIVQRQGICVTHRTKRGQLHTAQYGLPYKLEYSMVKREWYLLWYRKRPRAFLRTRLQQIADISSWDVPADEAEAMLAFVERTLAGRQTTVVLAIVPMYNKELSRILYALSCFEKDVTYDEQEDRYTVHIHLLGDEVEYLLSKIRFLGRRVRVTEGDYVKQRLLQASTMALERYGVPLPLSEKEQPATGQPS